MTSTKNESQKSEACVFTELMKFYARCGFDDVAKFMSKVTDAHGCPVTRETIRLMCCAYSVTCVASFMTDRRMNLLHGDELSKMKQMRNVSYRAFDELLSMVMKGLDTHEQ